MNRINETKKRLFGAVWVKKVVMMMVVLHSGLFLADMVCANNVRITGEPEVVLTATSDSLMLKFTLSWDNSWRDDFNWDAVWLFVKYKREGSQDAWNHLYLSPDQTGTVNLEMDPGNTGDKIVGAFVYPKNSGAFNINGEQVVLKAPLNGLSASDITNQKIYFAVQAIEMVLIPYGPYYLGDGFSHHTFRSVPTRIIPADADLIGTDTSFSYSCIPAALPQSPAEGAADRRNNSRWESPYSHICYPRAQDVAYNLSWTVNFGAPKIIRTFGVSFAKYTDSGGNYCPTENWYLLGSLDSLSWDTLSRCRISDAIAENVSYPVRHAIRVEHPGSYQYYRLFFPEVNDGRFGFMITNVAMSEQDLYPDASDNYYVDGEDAIPYGKILDGLYVDDGTTWSGSLPAAYPKGYKGFYMMKYELSQEQYVNFLNMLSYPQQKSRIGNNLDHLHRGDYVFGDPAHPSSRNGIAVFSHKGSAQPVVFGNNLNPADPFFAGDDGQTLACNFLTGPDMLAYLDWSGLRPLSELEYEKACRTPDRSLAGEYAWNTTAIHHLGGQSGLASSTEGTENEVPSALDINVNSGAPSFGPVRCGSFGSSTSNQQQSGTSFYGVMELSGNLGEMCYSVIGGSGLNVSSSNNEYHGDGLIASDGNHNVSGYWNGSSTTGMLSIRGGSFASPDSLLRISDRSVLMDYDNNLRDSTVTFRGVRSIGKSVDPGTITVSAPLCPDVTSTVSETGAASISGISGNFPLSYTWSYSKDNGSAWTVLAGETGTTLSYDAFEAGKTYLFRRTVVCALGEASAQTTGIAASASTVITVQPTDQDALCGLTIGVTATGTSLTYQWVKDGVNISGATSATYTKTSTTDADAGQYQCRVTGSCGAVLSDAATVTMGGIVDRTMTDSRDNKVYKTRIMPDGREWMVEDLRFGTCNNSTFNSYYQGSVKDQIADGYWGVCIASTQSGAGYLYNWQAAMQSADAVYGTSGNPSGNVNGNSPTQWRGICPKGWHLPSGGSTGEFQQLYDALCKQPAKIYPGTGVFNGVLAGYGYGSSVYNAGSYGFYWSSAYSSASYVYYLSFVSGNVNPQRNGDKKLGLAVRCIKDY